jgi:hypothetical protein
MTQERDKPAAMALERFETLVDAYGSESDLWPDDERASAQALLDQSDEAQRIVDEAAELDGLLGQSPAVEPSAALRQRVLDAAPSPHKSWLERLDGWTTSLWPFTPRWQPTLALGAAALFGIVIGASSPEGELVSDPMEVAELAFDVDYDADADDWSEMP